MAVEDEKFDKITPNLVHDLKFTIFWGWQVKTSEKLIIRSIWKAQTSKKKD